MSPPERRLGEVKFSDIVCGQGERSVVGTSQLLLSLTTDDDNACDHLRDSQSAAPKWNELCRGKP